MSPEHVLQWLAVETAATALVYSALGAAYSRRIAQVIWLPLAHCVVAAPIWHLLGGSGIAMTRGIIGAEALTLLLLSAAVARRREGQTAALIAGGVGLTAVVAPIFAEPVAAMLESGALVRTAASAISPTVATANASGVDPFHLPILYERTPASVMEMHMISPAWTLLGWLLAALSFAALLAMAGQIGRHRLVRGVKSSWVAGLAAMALLFAAPTGCKKNDDDKAGKSTAPAASTNTRNTDNPHKATVAPVGDKKPAAASKGPSRAEVEKSIGRGIEALLASADDKGIIGGHPGVTALAAAAIATAPNSPGKNDPRLKKSLDALAALANKDGSIFEKDYAAYVTALSLLAFQRSGAHTDLIGPAQRWLAGSQFQESSGTKPENPNYGGIGYGRSGDADLSNLHFALEALRETQFKDHPEVYERAAKFIERCQNRSETNDQKWAGDDGGFVYKPGVSKAGETKSSGSMTLAGIKSFLYADSSSAAKKDPRATAAMDWIRANYSVDENPGLGSKGLYYYFHMMARALALWGERELVDSDKVSHHWQAELSRKLLSLQNDDGTWKNEDATYWENNPAIATSRAVLALAYGLQSLSPQP